MDFCFAGSLWHRYLRLSRNLAPFGRRTKWTRPFLSCTPHSSLNMTFCQSAIVLFFRLLQNFILAAICNFVRVGFLEPLRPNNPYFRSIRRMLESLYLCPSAQSRFSCLLVSFGQIVESLLSVFCDFSVDFEGLPGGNFRSILPSFLYTDIIECTVFLDICNCSEIFISGIFSRNFEMTKFRICELCVFPGILSQISEILTEISVRAKGNDILFQILCFVFDRYLIRVVKTSVELNA